MGYIDIIIPLAVGLLAFFSPETIITNKDATFDKKKRILRIVGALLTGTSILYFVIKQFGSI